jgi:hypothetical protein
VSVNAVCAASTEVKRVRVLPKSSLQHNHHELDLFGQPVRRLQLVRLDRRTDRAKPCCDNIATIEPRHDGPHAAELRCANCGAHRGWMPHEAMRFVADLSRRFGAPTDPLILRDWTIGDQDMSINKQRENSGILFKNDRPPSDNSPDYTGSINVAGVEYYLNAWIKQGPKAKFMSLSVKPKDATRTKSDNELDDPVGF